MKTIIGVALISLALSGSVTRGVASEPPVVVSAVAPLYPVIAFTAHGSGDVVVAVDINKSGDVTSARAVNGHALLKKVSVEAAHRWKFSTGNEEHRQAELTFTFRIVPDKTAAVDRTAIFYPPYRVEVCNESVVTTTNY